MNWISNDFFLCLCLIAYLGQLPIVHRKHCVLYMIEIIWNESFTIIISRKLMNKSMHLYYTKSLMPFFFTFTKNAYRIFYNKQCFKQCLSFESRSCKLTFGITVTTIEIYLSSSVKQDLHHSQATQYVVVQKGWIQFYHLKLLV